MIYLSQSNKQGVSEVIGFVLIIIIAIGTSAFVVGAATNGPITALDDQSKHQQVQNTFSQISSSSVSSAIGGSGSSEQVNLAFAKNEGSAVEVREDSSVEVWSEDTSGNRTDIIDERLGYMKYEAGDGSTYYYENGGVWRIYENNEVNMITSPEFHYNERTLTLPLIQLNSEQDQYTNSMTFDHSNEARETGRMTIEDEIVYVKVTGPAYLGWGHYFETQLQYDSLTYDHENETVVMELGLGGEFLESFDSAILSSGDITTQGNGTINGDVRTSGDVDGNDVNGDVIQEDDVSLLKLDALIDTNVDDAKKNGVELDGSDLGGKTLTAGTYYVDNIHIEDEEPLTVDVSGGDVDLAVNGDVFIKGNTGIEVINASEDDSGTMKTYVEGDLVMQNGHPIWTIHEDNTGDNIVFGSSNSSASIGQNGTFEGVLYFPADQTDTGSSGSGENTDGDSGTSTGPGNSGKTGGGGAPGCSTVTTTFCIGSNAQLDGAVVTGSATLRSSSVINYDPDSLTSTHLTYSDSAYIRPRLAYVHTSTTTVDIREGS